MFYHAAVRIQEVGVGCIGQGVGIAAGPVVGWQPSHLARCRINTNVGVRRIDLITRLAANPQQDVLEQLIAD